MSLRRDELAKMTVGGSGRENSWCLLFLPGGRGAPGAGKLFSGHRFRVQKLLEGSLLVPVGAPCSSGGVLSSPGRRAPCLLLHPGFNLTWFWELIQLD